MPRRSRSSTHVEVNLSIYGNADVDPLGVIEGVSKGISNLDKALRDAVESARRRGHSWQEIADALGVTRQAAWERFSVEAPDRRDIISQVMGSLAGPGPTTDEMRAEAREEEAEADERKWGSA